MNLDRYERQLALPEISQAQQKALYDIHILIVGAGGLGCAMLPILAGAGIGKISMMDNDTVSRSNLHRQTLYKDTDIGKSKAQLAAQYAQSLNPDISIQAIEQRADKNTNINEYDLILDGTDNFETKTTLNALSIAHKKPLISAAVQQFSGQASIFAGYAKDQPCYHCLFPELPSDACNCNDAGILGSVANLAGLWQAHLTLCYLLQIGEAKPGIVLNFDFKNFRMQHLKLKKDLSCKHCGTQENHYTPLIKENKMPKLISLEKLNTMQHIVVDVRADWEIEQDPIHGAKGDIIHIELPTLPSKMNTLPLDTETMIAFVCAGNVRSAQAAQMLESLGHKNICILDKFSL